MNCFWPSWDAARTPRTRAPLEDAKPAELVLDTVAAHRQAAGVPLLREAGIVVELPEWWNTRDRGIGLRLSLTPSESRVAALRILMRGPVFLVWMPWLISNGKSRLAIKSCRLMSSKRWWPKQDVVLFCDVCMTNGLNWTLRSWLTPPLDWRGREDKAPFSKP